MKKRAVQSLSDMHELETPKGLFDTIMARIEKERRIINARRAFVVAGVAFSCAVIAFIAVAQFVLNGFVESGFLQVGSLLLADGALLIDIWHNFAFALLETFPTMHAAVFLMNVFAVITTLHMIRASVTAMVVAKTA